MDAIRMPPTPSWDGLHPLVVHFPIALLLTAPLFLLIALLWARRGRWAAVTALVLLSLGTGFAFVAAASGKAAAQLVEPGEPLSIVLDRHARLADITKATFTALTLAYGIVVLAQWRFPPLTAARYHLPLHVLFLLACAVACVILANTAHQGGTLVHQFGVRAVMDLSTGPAGP